MHIDADNVSGSHGPAGDEVVLHGNVRITRGRTVITADDGHYMRNQGLLLLDNQVKMVDSTTTVTCEHASYSETTDILTLLGNVLMHDRNATLRSPYATYDRLTGRIELSGPVEGRDSTERILADRATYVRDSMLVKARGHVRGFDDANKLELNAESLDYDRLHHLAVATIHPVMKATDKDGRVAEVRALMLRVNTETKVAEAIDSVHVLRDTLEARADHALFDDRADRGWFTGHPRVWDRETEVTGDTIEVHTDQRALKRVLVLHDATMDYRGIRPSSRGEVSRLIGDRIDVFFARDAIDSLVATIKARNDYQGAPEPGKTAERNEATGDTIIVFFKDRKIDRARVLGQAKGEYRLGVAVGDTTAAKKEIVQYDGRIIEFQVPKSAIVLDGAAHLTYQDLELVARRVVFDVDRQTLVAEGKPQLTDRGDKVDGSLMTYDLESRVGTIYQAQTAYEKGLYHGEQIRKVGDNVLDVMNGAYSTCDLDDPHYHFSARWMKIYLKDKLVAKPVVFYLKNVPVLALPFWVFPIKPGRHSGFLFPQFEFGLNNRAGQFVRNAGYYWAPNDYMDLTFSGDYYRAEPSWVMRADGQYRLLYLLDGTFRGSYARNEGLHREDWDFTADHEQQLSARTRMVARAQFVSSRDYSSSPFYGLSLAQRLNRFLISSVAISHAADWANVSLVIDRRQDIDADLALQNLSPLLARPGTLASLPNLTQSEPSLAVSFPTRTIGSFGPLKGTAFEKPLSSVYFSLSSQFVSVRERRAFIADTFTTIRDSVPTASFSLGQQLKVRRGFSTTTSLFDSRRAFGWLNVQPRLNGNLVVFDFDELGHRVVPAATWTSGLSMSTSFYGTFRPHIGSLTGIRHVLFPSVSVSYSPEFSGLTYRDSRGFLRSRFNSFGGIGISGFKSAFMSLSLGQRLQAKFQNGDKVTRLDNLLAWDLSTNYDFLYREHRRPHPFDAIRSSVAVQPPGVMSANLSWTFDPYARRRFNSFGYNLGLNLSNRGARTRSTPALPLESTRSDAGFTEDWSLGLAYSYSGGYAGSFAPWTSQQTANGVLHYQFSPGWGLEYSTSYDATLRDLTTQRFSLTRDLHCWTAAFTRTFVIGGEAEYYFRIGIKDQREIYLERGTRTGSLGGIQ